MSIMVCMMQVRDHPALPGDDAAGGGLLPPASLRGGEDYCQLHMPHRYMLGLHRISGDRINRNRSGLFVSIRSVSFLWVWFFDKYGPVSGLFVILICPIFIWSRRNCLGPGPVLFKNRLSFLIQVLFLYLLSFTLSITAQRSLFKITY